MDKAVPARHNVPENGYVLEANSQTLYVAGDTRFDAKLFHEIANRYPKIDAALLPIGGIWSFGRRLDMNPEEAADAFLILKPGNVIPYHYGLTGPFPFLTSRSEPDKDFLTAIDEKNGGDHSAVVILETGQSWHHYR